jgi:hypothetical protein
MTIEVIGCLSAATIVVGIVVWPISAFAVVCCRARLDLELRKDNQ